MQRWMGAIKLVATEAAEVAGSGYHQQLQWHLAAALVAAVGNEVLPL